MQFSLNKKDKGEGKYELDTLQRYALGGLLVLTIFTFIGTNIEAVLWRSSQWLVSSVLPSVVVDLTNKERADLAEPSLHHSAVLDAAAQMKADDMAKRGYFAHFAPDGTSPWHWFDEAGYRYAYAGENLAVHFTDSGEVVDAWMNSPKHRENIVNKNFTEIGVGTAKGTYEGYDTVFVVQLFGTPAVAPVVKTAVAPVSAKTVAVAPAPAPKPKPVAVPSTATTSQPKDEKTVLAKTDVTPKPVEVTAREEDTPTTASSSDIVVVPATTNNKVINAENPNDVIVETELISTSSGLAVANIETPTNDTHAGRFAFITQPNRLLKIAYALFGFIVIGLLLASVISEAKRGRSVQVAYGVGLLLIMLGLWYINFLLTAGAVVV
jgi:hypothetical protein